MSKNLNETVENATLKIFKAFTTSEQFRISRYLSSILRCTTPSPSTRWYDYCHLMWPNDWQGGKMDKYVTFADIQRRLRDGEPLRSIIAPHKLWIGLRWYRRIRNIIDQPVYFGSSYREWLKEMEWI